MSDRRRTQTVVRIENQGVYIADIAHDVAHDSTRRSVYFVVNQHLHPLATTRSVSFVVDHHLHRTHDRVRGIAQFIFPYYGSHGARTGIRGRSQPQATLPWPGACELASSLISATIATVLYCSLLLHEVGPGR